MRFYVDEARRLVRTCTEGREYDRGWKRVTAEEYDAFRKETSKIPAKKLREMRQPA